jgi:hypothetical protein
VWVNYPAKIKNGNLRLISFCQHYKWWISTLSCCSSFRKRDHLVWWNYLMSKRSRCKSIKSRGAVFIKDFAVTTEGRAGLEGAIRALVAKVRQIDRSV